MQTAFGSGFCTHLTICETRRSVADNKYWPVIKYRDCTITMLSSSLFRDILINLVVRISERIDVAWAYPVAPFGIIGIIRNKIFDQDYPSNAK